MSLFNTSSLVGLNVLITGASGGIGAATACLFAKAGSNVIITARRVDKLEQVKLKAEEEAQCFKNLPSTTTTPNSYRKQPQVSHQEGREGQVLVRYLDMTQLQSIEEFIPSLPDEWKNIDILVNNAGLVLGREHVGQLTKFNESEVLTMINTNLIGLIKLTHMVVPLMKKRGRGHIVNIGSIAGREPYAGGSIYCATKHAVRAFSGALLRELVDTPIRVTEVQPGMVETEFSVTRFRGDQQAADQVYQGLQPLYAQDIAEEIVWCTSRPPHVQIAELFVLPTSQASATLNHREPIESSK